MDAVPVCIQCVPSCLIVANICFPRISRIGRIKIQKWHLNPNVERFQRQRPFWWDGYWSRWDSTEIQRRLDPCPIWCSPNAPIFGEQPAPPTTPITQANPWIFFLCLLCGVFLVLDRKFMSLSCSMLSNEAWNDSSIQKSCMKWRIKGWPMRQHEGWHEDIWGGR